MDGNVSNRFGIAIPTGIRKSISIAMAIPITPPQVLCGPVSGKEEGHGGSIEKSQGISTPFTCRV
jgi:hypothetical protein